MPDRNVAKCAEKSFIINCIILFQVNSWLTWLEEAESEEEEEEDEDD